MDTENIVYVYVDHRITEYLSASFAKLCYNLQGKNVSSVIWWVSPHFSFLMFVIKFNMFLASSGEVELFFIINLRTIWTV